MVENADVVSELAFTLKNPTLPLQIVLQGVHTKFVFGQLKRHVSTWLGCFDLPYTRAGPSFSLNQVRRVE